MGIYDLLSPEEKQLTLGDSLIGFGAGMLQNSGWSTDPRNKSMLPAFGQGLSGMMGAGNNALANIQQMQDMGAKRQQMQMLQDQLNEEKALMQRIQELFKRKPSNIPWQYSYPTGG